MAKGFFKGVKSELKKVVWPTKKQLVHNTVMVVVLIVALSVIVLGFDMILEFADSKIWNMIGGKIG
jgi:preprotein translocase subunit SecE